MAIYTHGRRGRPGTRPHGAKYQSRNRRTSRLSGREALINQGVGAKEAPPQARTRLTRAGIGTAGETAGTGRDGTAGVSSRVTSVAGADGFSVKPTTKLEASNRFRFHTAAQRWAAGMEAETPTPDRQRPQDAVFSILEITTGRCRDWGRDGLVCAEAKQKGCHRGRGRRHWAGGS